MISLLYYLSYVVSGITDHFISNDRLRMQQRQKSDLFLHGTQREREYYTGRYLLAVGVILKIMYNVTKIYCTAAVLYKQQKFFTVLLSPHVVCVHTHTHTHAHTLSAESHSMHTEKVFTLYIAYRIISTKQYIIS